MPVGEDSVDLPKYRGRLTKHTIRTVSRKAATSIYIATQYILGMIVSAIFSDTVREVTNKG
jgi:hypothetical protein